MGIGHDPPRPPSSPLFRNGQPPGRAAHNGARACRQVFKKSSATSLHNSTLVAIISLSTLSAPCEHLIIWTSTKYCDSGDRIEIKRRSLYCVPAMLCRDSTWSNHMVAEASRLCSYCSGALSSG